MSPTLTIFVISTSGLLLLVLLLVVEDRRGSRLFLGRVRSMLDTGLFVLQHHTEKAIQKFGGSAVRQLLHFIIHKFLRVLLMGVRGLEFVLRKLQRTNRNVAYTIELADEDTHLGEVRAHRESIKLSDEEKRQKRREMLE